MQVQKVNQYQYNQSFGTKFSRPLANTIRGELGKPASEINEKGLKTLIELTNDGLDFVIGFKDVAVKSVSRINELVRQPLAIEHTDSENGVRKLIDKILEKGTTTHTRDQKYLDALNLLEDYKIITRENRNNFANPETFEVSIYHQGREELEDFIATLFTQAGHDKYAVEIFDNGGLDSTCIHNFFDAISWPKFLEKYKEIAPKIYNALKIVAEGPKEESYEFLDKAADDTVKFAASNKKQAVVDGTDIPPTPPFDSDRWSRANEALRECENIARRQFGKVANRHRLGNGCINE